MNTLTQIDLEIELAKEIFSAKSAWINCLEKMIAKENLLGNKEILRQIMLDEQKHLRIILNSYQTGFSPEITTDSQPPDYKVASLVKLKSAEFSRRLFYITKDLEKRDMIFEIICDDTSNSIRFLTLLHV